jgi:hypothetical protein
MFVSPEGILLKTYLADTLFADQIRMPETRHLLRINDLPGNLILRSLIVIARAQSIQEANELFR